MEIGILTACTGKPQKNKGLYDIINEIDEREDINYRIINPQDIFFEGNNFKYYKRKKEYIFSRNKKDEFVGRKWLKENEVRLFKEEFSDVDYLYIRGFKPASWESEPIIVKRAIEKLDIPMTNSLESIKYCNNKIYSILDILTCNIEIDGFELKELIPKTRIFNLKNSNPENKEEVKEYIRTRFQGGHTPVVAKDHNGRGGGGIMPFPIGSPYRALIDNYERTNFIVQDMKEGCIDLRVQIVGSGYYENDIKGSYIREPSEGDFRAQYNKKKEHYELSELQKKISLWIHKRSGVDISAIDFLLNPDTDEIYFLEINGENPGWKNLKKVYKDDEIISKNGLAPYLIDHMIDKYRLLK